MFTATIAAVTAGKLRRGMISSVPTGANIFNLFTASKSLAESSWDYFHYQQYTYPRAKDKYLMESNQYLWPI
jgi:hypothetical protein